MCNEVRRRIALGELREDWGETRIPLRFPEGAPNMAPLDSVRITDPTPILRAARDAPGEAGFDKRHAPGIPLAAELVTRRWSWPGPMAKPVYNFRSEGRDLRHGRCLIPVDGFYEFTAPTASGKKRKDKWLFTWPPHRWFAVAGLWRTDPSVGEAFTLLTTEPGPDVAPYHSRQIVLIDRTHWASWLDETIPAQRLIVPLPAGTLAVEQVG